jgi:transmembrane sensor
MSRKDLSLLLQKYLDGQCSGEEKLLMEDWLADLGKDQPLTAIPFKDLPVIEQRIWERLVASRRRTQPRVPRYMVSAAASLLLLFGASWIIWKTIYTHPSDRAWSHIINSTTHIETVRLEDGTSISLKPSAHLDYPLHFPRNSRSILLGGDAFFDVAQDPQRPFTVYAGSIVTKVLGTSFWVRQGAHPRDQEVEVVSGKVSVYKGADANNGQQVVVLPNQKVIFQSREDRFLTTITDHPHALEIAKDSLSRPAGIDSASFNNAPLSRVVEVLEKEYGIPIVLQNMEMRDWKFTGDLSGIEYYEKLRMICKVTGSGYVKQGDSILIREEH